MLRIHFMAALNLSQLTCEVLRLRLMEARLPTRGNKAALVERLLTHERACDPKSKRMTRRPRAQARTERAAILNPPTRPVAAGFLVGLGVSPAALDVVRNPAVVRTLRHPAIVHHLRRLRPTEGLARLPIPGTPRVLVLTDVPGCTAISPVPYPLMSFPLAYRAGHARPLTLASRELSAAHPARHAQLANAVFPIRLQSTPRVQTRGRVSGKHLRLARRRVQPRSRSTSPTGTEAHKHRQRPPAEQRDGVVCNPLPAKALPFFSRSRHRDTEDSHHRRRKRRRAHHHTDSSSSSSCSSDSSGSSRDRRRHHRRRRRSSSLESFSDPPFTSCSATPAKYLIKRIRRGKFVAFDKLLLPVIDETLAVHAGQAAKRSRDYSSAKRRVIDLASWLEAWNIFLAVRLQVSPSSALQLAKYQAIMCQLFSSYPVGVCIKYDSLFRQAAAWDRSHLTPWNQVKDDILLWCATRHPFRSARQPNASTLQTSTANSSSRATQGRVTHTPSGQEICRKYNYSSCTRADCSFAHKCWLAGCLGDHPGKSCPRAPAAPG